MEKAHGDSMVCKKQTMVKINMEKISIKEVAINVRQAAINLS